ncbi:MAG: tetratricopeptide repeat protein, partial [Phycisphaeraceae bacterium]
MARAQGLADRGWHERAVRLLADAVEANPTTREPRLALGGLLAEMQRPADAKKVLAPMLDRADGSTDRGALVHLAVAWAGTDDGDQLAALLEERRGFIDASSSPGLKALAELARGRYASAASRVESALNEDVEHSGEGVLLRIVAARACERLGRFDAAQRHLQSLAMQRPHRPLAFDLLVRLHLRQPGEVDADAGFAGLEKVSPYLTPLARASLLTRERKLESAEATLRDALQRAVDAKHPGAVELAHALAEVRFERGESTVPAFSPLVRAQWLPGTAVLGAIEWRERERDRPLSSGWSLRVAEHVTGDELSVHQRIAERLWGMGDAEAAIGEMQQALRTTGNDTSNARRLAAMLESRGRVGEAIEVLEPAIASRPDHAGLALQWSETLDRAGELPAAESAYRQAMNLDPVTRIRAALRLQELFERAGVASEAMLVLDDAAATAASHTDTLPLSLYAALHERRA